MLAGQRLNGCDSGWRRPAGLALPTSLLSRIKRYPNSKKKGGWVGIWRAQSEECVTLDLGVVSSSPMLEVEVT